MGCDIHEYVEVKIGGEWIYIGGIVIPRNYALFGVLAGVRNENIACVTGDYRGLPDDLDEVLEQISDEYGSDGHSHSYLYLNELEQAKDIYYEHFKGTDEEHVRDWPECLDNLYLLKELEGVDDVRFVFWFDN